MNGETMTDLKRGLRFTDLTRAPESAGIYAWYYRIELSDKDILDCINTCVVTVSLEQKCEIVRTFLERRLFNHYREQPYFIKLTGALKPEYSGTVENQYSISQSLVNRLAVDPHRLKRLKYLLHQAVPFFASPIYIGIAANLRTRLLKHKTLIERYQQSMAAMSADLPSESESESDAEAVRDHSFAKEVATTRRFVAYNLFVHVMELGTEEDMRGDLENLLNRINFPLCGRN
jgi:hypothetical protein